MPVVNSNSVSFDILAERLTPFALRRPVWLAFIRTLLTPINTINASYMLFKSKKIQRMSYNGQVRLLENIINRLMLGEYDPDMPYIYLDEPEKVNDFLVSPDGRWQLQNSIHYDLDGKQYWDYQQHDPEEPPEDYSILYDKAASAQGIGFEIHIAFDFGPQAHEPEIAQAFIENGGDAALRSIVDTYKLAGKKYVVIYDYGEP